MATTKKKTVKKTTAKKSVKKTVAKKPTDKKVSSEKTTAKKADPKKPVKEKVAPVKIDIFAKHHLFSVKLPKGTEVTRRSRRPVVAVVALVHADGHQGVVQWTSNLSRARFVAKEHEDRSKDGGKGYAKAFGKKPPKWFQEHGAPVEVKILTEVKDLGEAPEEVKEKAPRAKKNKKSVPVDDIFKTKIQAEKAAKALKLNPEKVISKVDEGWKVSLP